MRASMATHITVTNVASVELIRTRAVFFCHPPHESITVTSERQVIGKNPCYKMSNWGALL